MNDVDKAKLGVVIDHAKSLFQQGQHERAQKVLADYSAAPDAALSFAEHCGSCKAKTKVRIAIDGQMTLRCLNCNNPS